MNKKILHCCSSKSTLLVLYEIGSKFFVCDKCINLDIWSRGIKEKKILSDSKLSLSQEKGVCNE